jgi:hypothetical protein
MFVPLDANNWQNTMVELWDYSLLIPLNVCRRQNNFKPWECDHERHTYEKCVLHVVTSFHSLLIVTSLGANTMSTFSFIPYGVAYPHPNPSYVRRMKDLAKQKQEALAEDS